MAVPPHRRALGALFLLLAAAFAGVAFTAGSATGGGAGRWIVAVCAGAIAVWFVGLMLRAFRSR
ncbi:MAG TPA: hypothetical protein VFA44_03330 [Gaiellaceae bacterium]|nr:hypothetical protein [Gaiellaceae bacterium]